MRAWKGIFSTSFAVLLGILLVLVAVVLTHMVTLWNRVPAEYLPGSEVELLLEERGSASLAEDHWRLSSFLPRGMTLPTLPPDLSSSLVPQRTISLLSQSGSLKPLVFYRLPASGEVHRQAREFALKRGGVSVAGLHLVLGQGDILHLLLKPPSEESLERLSTYREALRYISPSSQEVLYMREQREEEKLLSLPRFFKAITGSAPWFLLAREENTTTSFSLVLPPLSPASRRASHFSSLFSDSLSPLLAVTGSDVGRELSLMLSLFAGADADRALVLEGVLAASFSEMFGRERTLSSLLTEEFQGAPYAFLLRGAEQAGGQNSGGTLAALFAVEQGERGDGEDLIRELEGGFSSVRSLATVRRRELPSGKVVWDIVADALALERREEVYRGYRVRQLRHLPTGREFVSARKNAVLLLSSDRALLKSALDALSEGFLTKNSQPPSRESTHAVLLDERLLERSAALLHDDPFFQSLHSFLSAGTSMLWERFPQGPVVRQMFVFSGSGRGLESE